MLLFLFSHSLSDIFKVPNAESQIFAILSAIKSLPDSILITSPSPVTSFKIPPHDTTYLYLDTGRVLWRLPAISAPGPCKI